MDTMAPVLLLLAKAANTSIDAMWSFVVLTSQNVLHFFDATASCMSGMRYFL